MKKFYEKQQTAEGWDKLNTLFGLLIVILFITTVGQLFVVKDVKPLEVIKNVFSGTYVVGQYINYGLYVMAKMLVITVPTIGAALLIRMINYKNTLNVKSYRIAGTGGLVFAVFIWVVVLMVSYFYKIDFEENYLLFDELTNMEGLYQMYEYVLPAFILTFIDDAFSEIRSAKKMEQRKKLLPDVETEIVKIFSEGDLAQAEQLHLLRNLKKQTKNYLENKH